MSLFTPLQLGAVTLQHRIAMAPLTRMRAGPGNAPVALNGIYYGQRATPGGLIIAEASQVVPGGTAGPDTPGSYTKEQVAGWKLVTDAIKAKGGVAFLQLWHTGRISHSSYQPDGGVPVAPSAVKADGIAFTKSWGREPFETPREMRLDEIPALIEAYKNAAKNALEAGFDGVELHSANGYLLEQFLLAKTNKRTDQYGGSIENRCRLVLEVTNALTSVVGSDRVGIRLSPYGIANDSASDEDPMPLFTYLIKELDKLNLAYLHLIEPRASGAGQKEVDWENVPSAAALFRPMWHGPLIAAGNFKPNTAREIVERGDADIVAFGRLFISNAHLVEKIRNGVELRHYDRPTFYGGNEKGYTDYED